jgi:uncharacterized repeat protein (TIGR01451 family)
MNRSVRLLASASVLAAAGFSANPAFAAGTAAGTTVTNTVTLDYKVGGVSQNPITATDTFTVDRKVDVNVVENGSSTTTVSPGQESVVTSFIVSTASNAPIDLAIAASQLSGGTAAHGGTDNFNVTDLQVYRDSNNNGAYDSGVDAVLTYFDQVVPDTNLTVFVVAKVPLGRSTGDVAGVRLTATAAEATAAGSQGATIVQTTGANTSGMDTVFADGTTGGNTARDGIHFAEDDYTVLAATLTATKTSRVISDPVSGLVDPKMIPGAVVEYCIAVANASGSATASNVNVTDTLPATTTYQSSFGIKLNGTVTGSTCNADGTSGGTYADGVVGGQLTDIAGGVARTLVFRVTVN